MTQLTSIVTSQAQVGIISVRAHAGWMDEASIDRYLEGFGQCADGVTILFSRIVLDSGINFGTDGGWTSAHRHGGRWIFAKGH